MCTNAQQLNMGTSTLVERSRERRMSRCRGETCKCASPRIAPPHAFRAAPGYAPRTNSGRRSRNEPAENEVRVGSEFARWTQLRPLRPISDSKITKLGLRPANKRSQHPQFQLHAEIDMQYAGHDGNAVPCHPGSFFGLRVIAPGGWADATMPRHLCSSVNAVLISGSPRSRSCALSSMGLAPN